MRKLLLTTLFVLPTVLAGLPSAAQAAPTPTVVVSPEKVYPVVEPCTGAGPSDFTVTGTGFESGEEIRLWVGGEEYEPFAANRKGRFTETQEIRSLPSGTYPVLLVGDQGSQAEDEIYIGWSGCRGTRRGELTVAGAGFAAEDQIRVRVDGELVDVVDSEVGGTFETTVDCEPGEHTAKVSDSENRSLTFKTFTC